MVRRNARASMTIEGEERASPAPSITAVAPTDIGLRTYRQGPAAPNSRGGSNGAGVPRPLVTNVAMQMPARTAPAEANTNPSGRSQIGNDAGSLSSSDRTEIATHVHSHTKVA